MIITHICFGLHPGIQFCHLFCRQLHKGLRSSKVYDEEKYIYFNVDHSCSKTIIIIIYTIDDDDDADENN
jgi:hypothetical protein